MASAVTANAGDGGAYPAGWRRWVLSANHKDIGTRYLVFALVAGVVGGALSMLMRIELQSPGLQIFASEQILDVVVAGHAMIMVFFTVMPALIGGFGNWFVPITIGAPDMAFPRLNNLSFWLLVAAFGLLVASMFLPGLGAPALPIAGLSLMLGAVNIITTVLNMRAPGMTLSRMPPFAWSMLVTAFLVLMSLPVIAGAVTMLLAGHAFGIPPFLDPARAGSGPAGHGQHLFWFLAHPEVYIMILPAFGVVSHVVATFARRPLAGGPAVPCAMVALGLVGFAVWTRHLYGAGMWFDAQDYFLLSMLVIAVPAGIMIGSWIVTMGRGPVSFATPMMWALGFIVLFVGGGVTGVAQILAGFGSAGRDIGGGIAHFHYMLSLGAVFAIFAGWYYWFPKMFGYTVPEWIGKLHFWLAFAGANMMFLPASLFGLAGAMRHDAGSPADGWGWHDLVPLGTLVFAAGLAVFFVGIGFALVRKRRAGNNPWGDGATTLEWTIPSPPPYHQFEKLPLVAGSGR